MLYTYIEHTQAAVNQNAQFRFGLLRRMRDSQNGLFVGR
ncbi:SMC domain protein [Alicyclobacillus hesperidum URH17-3-68]|nr:SMC domain protein [Alicyclobacillus hesperidum URH17-3-68]